MQPRSSKEIKNVMVEPEKAASFGSRTILFVDEHRFNKAQQDAFLPLWGARKQFG